MWRLGAPLAAALVLASACSQKVNLRVESPHSQVLLNGTDVGPVPADGADIEVRPGMKALQYEIKNGTTSKVGSIPRSEPIWWMLAAAVGGAVCCAPTLAAGGFCLANPTLLGAPLVVLATGDVTAVTATCASPSWFTLPAVAGCGALGLSPLGLGLIAETVPERIVLKGADDPAPGSASSGAPAGKMEF